VEFVPLLVGLDDESGGGLWVRHYRYERGVIVCCREKKERMRCLSGNKSSFVDGGEYRWGLSYTARAYDFIVLSGL